MIWSNVFPLLLKLFLNFSGHLFLLCDGSGKGDLEIMHSLYDCRQDQHSKIPPCRDSLLMDRPEIRRPIEIFKPNPASSRFPITLNASAQYINLFQAHYAPPIPRLNLSHHLNLPPNQHEISTEVWSFNGGIPGPTIRAQVGDTLEIQLRNALPVSTSLFFSGVFNAKDPIEGDFVISGQTRKYDVFEISLSQAGTFLYSSAVDPQRQVPMGLYGLLIVTEKVPTADDHVIIIGAPTMHHVGWQILPPFSHAMRKAEEQYNGRRGNMVLINGDSTSVGLQLTLTSGTIHKLRLANVANARYFEISIYPTMEFSIETQWIGADFYSIKQNGHKRHSFIMPPGSTATMSLDIDDSLVGRELQVVVKDPIALSERRRSKSKDKEPDSIQTESVVISETCTSITSTHGVKVVELLLMPSNDGILTSNGFIDALHLPKSQISGAVEDSVAIIAMCYADEPCNQPTWGFDLASFIPTDGEILEVSLFFEIFCPRGSEIPRIDIRLYPIDSNFIYQHVPDGHGIFSNLETPSEPVVAHSIVSCLPDKSEAPVDLRSLRLNRFLQEALHEGHKKGGKGQTSLYWMRGSFEFEPSAKGHSVLLPTRVASELPPPILRVVYKTANRTVCQTDQIQSIRPQDFKVRRQQLQRVLHELQNEQQDLKIQLQTLYDHVKQRQSRQTNPVPSDVLERRQLENAERQRRQTELLQELQSHLKQQEEQREIERRFIQLESFELPENYKNQLLKELQKQLQQHHLKQRIYQLNLKQKLALIGQDTTNMINSAFRGSTYRQQSQKTPISQSEINSLKQKKLLYMRLYKHYNDIAGQVRHVKDLAKSLDKTSSDPFMKQLNARSIYHTYLELDSGELPEHSQSLFRLGIVQGLSAIAGESEHEAHRHRWAEDVGERQVNVGNSSMSLTEYFNRRTGVTLPIVYLTLGQANMADFSGTFPMWIETSTVYPDVSSTTLVPGSFVIWEIKNQFRMTETLYFHRTLLELYDKEDVYHNESVIRQSIGIDNPMNGRLVGVTIPSIEDDQKYTVVRAISRVPKLTSVSKARKFLRWDIRVQSSILEHLANGMTSRILINVLSTTSSDTTLLQGIDFSYSAENQSSGMRLNLLGAVVFGVFILFCVLSQQCIVFPKILTKKRRISNSFSKRPQELSYSVGDAKIPFMQTVNQIDDQNREKNVQKFTSGSQNSVLQSPDDQCRIKHRSVLVSPNCAIDTTLSPFSNRSLFKEPLMSTYKFPK